MGRFLLLLAAVVLADFWLLVQFAGWLGFWPTLLLVLASSMLGARLARREGLRVLERWRNAMLAHEVPEEGALGGVLVFAGGVLLVVPGPLTTLAGLTLVVPPSRRLVATLVRSWMARRMYDGTIRSATFSVSIADGRDAPAASRWSRQVIDTQGEVVSSTEIGDDAPILLPPARQLED